MLFCVNKIIFNDFIIKMAFLIITLFTSIPFVHAYIGSYVKTLLIWSLIILSTRLFKNRYTYQASPFYFLGSFLIIYGISILSNNKVFLNENISQWCYMITYFFVLYYCDRDKKEQQILNEIKIISNTIICITAVFSLVSFYTFLISYSSHYNSPNGWMYLGMFENRLWGLYNPNTGGTLNFISIVLSLSAFCLYQKNKYKFLYLINAILQFFCLILTQSRASYAIFTLFIALLFCFFIYKKFKSTKHKHSFALSIPFTILIAFITIVVASPVKDLLSYLPVPFQNYTHLSSSVSVNWQQSKVNRAFYMPKLISYKKHSTEDQLQDKIKPVALERMEELENRPGGLLTGRQDLWKGGIKAFLHHPILGVTHEGIPTFVKPFISSIWYKNLKVGGLHNIYLTILVSSGVLGFLALAGFALFTMIQTIKVFKKSDVINHFIIYVLGIMIFCFYIVEFFESRILFQVNFFGVFFWIFYGYVMNSINKVQRHFDFEKGEN